nr:TIM-barrel domain-containing protein [Bacteroides sp.]
MSKSVKKWLALGICLMLVLSPLRAQIHWTLVEPGVWKGVVGTPEEYSLLSVSGKMPLKEGFTRLPAVTLPALADEITATLNDGKTYITIPLQRQEQLYGFGLNFKTVHQRGRILNLHVDHYGGKDDGRTHAPVPFYVSSCGYGILINSARYLTVYAGSGSRKDSPDAPVAKDRNTDKTWSANPYSDAVSVLVPAPGVEIYLFAGPQPMDVVRRYNLFCGGGTLPPRWGLGFTHRTPSLYTADQVKQEAEEFERRGYPLDFIGLEPGWQSKSYPCTFEWDKQRFPQPKAFVDEMKKRGIRINLWTNPYVSPESDIYEQMFPLSGSHTVWCGIVPDLAHEKGRRLWMDKLDKEHVGIGVSGYKVDEVDGYDRWLWPDVATFPSGVSAEQMRQTYGLWVQRTTTDLYRQRNQRTYGLVRASNAGASAYPYVIYNDYYSHPDFITALINSGFCGVLWTPEVRGSKTAEEWLRRFQTVVFSPMAMLNAWASGTKPWSFPEVAEQVKEYALLRMRMIPYWYTEFARYHFDGIPPFRAMNLEAGFSPSGAEPVELQNTNANLETNPYLEAVSKEIKDQYMAGEYLLIAPLFAGQTQRKVVLPKGNWYDFYTGKYVGNGETITVSPGLDRIPVFVKDGAIIPLMEPLLHAPTAGQKMNLEIRHYGKADGFYRFYDDDGETYDYERGEYTWRDIRVTRDRKGRLKGSISKAERGKPDNIGTVNWRFMTQE